MSIFKEIRELEGFLQNAKNNAKISFKNVKPTKLKHRVTEAEKKLRDVNVVFEKVREKYFSYQKTTNKEIKE